MSAEDIFCQDYITESPVQHSPPVSEPFGHNFDKLVQKSTEKRKFERTVQKSYDPN